MELTGDIVINAPRERVWQGLNDVQVLLASIPGCEEVRRLSPSELHARVQLAMGPVRARFVGKILMSDVRAGEGCVLSFEGSGGAAGFASGRSTVSLASVADGTRLSYSAQAAVGGKLGQIGGRMIDASAKQMADRFFRAFSEQLSAPAATTAGDAESPVPQVVATRVAAAAPASASEGLRVLWFALGAAATGFGFWLARALGH